MTEPQAADDISVSIIRRFGHKLTTTYGSIVTAEELGLAYAIPQRHGRVLEIDATRLVLREIGEPGEDICEHLQTEAQRPSLSLYDEFARARNGCFYAAPASARRVLELDPAKQALRFIGPDLAPESVPDDYFHGLYTAIAAAADGCLYAPPYGHGRVLKIDPASSEVAKIGPEMTFRAGPYQALYSAIALAPNGHLYCPPFLASHVLDIDPERGTVSQMGSHIGPPRTHMDHGQYCCVLRASSNGKLYAPPKAAERVLEIDPTSGTARQIGAVDIEGEFYCICEAQNGHLYSVSGGCWSTLYLLDIDPVGGSVVVHKVEDLMQESPKSVEGEYTLIKAAGNGRVYGIPDRDGRLLEYDTRTEIVREIGEEIAHGPACGATLNNRVFVLPDVREQPEQVLMIDYNSFPVRPAQVGAAWMEELLKGDLSDVTLRASDGKTRQAHKLVLSARSSVFRAMFQSNMRESQDRLVELGEVSPAVFDMFVNYIYSADAMASPRIRSQDVCDLLLLAHRYELGELVADCVVVLCKSLSVECVLSILVVADRLELVELKQGCLSFIVEHHDRVTETTEWAKMTSPALLREIAEAAFDVGSGSGSRSRKRRRDA